MALKKYTYNNNIYYINPDKINYLTNGQSVTPFAGTGSSLFTIFFDNQKAISISFHNQTEGMSWVDDNFITPQILGETSLITQDAP